MKVKELIERLQKYPDQEATCWCWGGGYIDDDVEQITHLRHYEDGMVLLDCARKVVEEDIYPPEV